MKKSTALLSFTFLLSVSAGCATDAQNQDFDADQAGSLDGKADGARSINLPASPFAGHIQSPTSAYFSMSNNAGFSKVSLKVGGVFARFPSAVAFGELSLSGERTNYVVHFYNVSGKVYTPVGNARGYIVGGDEFTVSTPGQATFDSALSISDARAPSSIRSAFSGSMVDPIGTLYQLRNNAGISSVNTKLKALLATHGANLVAIGEQSFQGANDVFTVHYYSRQGGVLTAVADVTGNLIGGDETTASTPGLVSYRAL
jgi:hypothetical protein